VTTDIEAVVNRVADVRRRVEAQGGDPARIRIVAVTKGFGVDAMVAAQAAGLSDVGENYAQEMLGKVPQAPAGTKWHFLGPIQRNKVARLARSRPVWHGIDRPAAADAVAAAAPGSEVMVQVNVVGAANRPGCPVEGVADLVAHVRTLPLDLSGLMAVGPAEVGPASRDCFRWLAHRAAGLGLHELSMGMSDDFEMAVAEGATTLRLGRVLFGARPEPKARPAIGLDTGGI
jgi:pyridoxal phosphate enzyme (YggS family)